MAIIHTTNLSKNFNNKNVVEDISLDIEEGSVFGFLGPNGAGKSTTIRMFLNLIKPTSGKIKILGYDIAKDYNKVAPQIAAIVETPTFFPYLNAIQTLQTFSDYCNLSKSQTELEYLLDKCGILYAAKERVDNFSLGMKQRLGIATALINSPKIIFLDEPANGLDPEGILKIRKLIRQFAEEEKRTIFISSHLLSEVEQMCDEVAILHKGKLKIKGKVSDLLRNERVIVKTSSRDLAMKTLAEAFPNVEFEKNHLDESIILKVASDKVPQIIKNLVRANIDIYEVFNTRQTLEELFQETVESE